MRYVCKICGYKYNETTKGPMPEDYICPLCGADRSQFEWISPPEAKAP